MVTIYFLFNLITYFFIFISTLLINILNIECRLMFIEYFEILINKHIDYG